MIFVCLGLFFVCVFNATLSGIYSTFSDDALRYCLRPYIKNLQQNGFFV
jgi:hypothetical protein